MKNIIFVDLDTDREEEPVRLGKIDYKIPEDPDKFTEDVMLDLKTLIEGIFVIGTQLDSRDVQAFDDTVDEVVGQLRLGWSQNNEPTEPEEEKE